MIKLEIIVQTKSEKHLEFSQTLEFIKSDLSELCESLTINEEGSSFSIITEVNSVTQLTNVLYSTELSILSGAIRTLAEKSEIIIHGIDYKKRSNSLREIRLNYSKKEKEIKY